MLPNTRLPLNLTLRVLSYNKLVLKKGKVYVPKDEKLRAEIIQLHHDVPVARHRGKWKIIELVMRNYW